MEDNPYMNNFSVPVLGFSAFSGTGKTTLLTKLIPLLKAEGLRIGLVKHAHHNFNIDHPGKDSYRLREAGASQVMVASRKLKAWICERADEDIEPTLEELLATFETDSLDLILLESFKHGEFPKIELHRPALGKPLMFPDDDHVIAIASDDVLPIDSGALPKLDLNVPSQLRDFILYDFLKLPKQA